MSTRRYEISFRAELDDRQVDDLADTLFELGYDDICFRPLEDPPGKRPRSNQPCDVCGASAYVAHEPGCPWLRADHHSRADSTADRDALQAANQHDIARSLKW